MRFLADLGVDLRVVTWLRQDGHDATHLRDERLHRMPNGDIFAKALAESRGILTFDLDFAEIAALSRTGRVSVVVFRLHNTRTVHVIQRLAAVLAESAAELSQGAVLTIEETRHRIRRLPVGEAG